MNPWKFIPNPRSLLRPHMCFYFIDFGLIFVFYFYEVYIVMPVLARDNISIAIHTINAHFILFNVIGNLIMGIGTDSSIRGKILVNPSGDADWRVCTKCETIVPLRCWHCDECRTCILTRDHHCSFLGNCVGYQNHRYFIMFLAYIFIAMTYTLYYNFEFLLRFKFTNSDFFLFLFPMASLSYDFNLKHLAACMLVINVLLFAITGVFLISHMVYILKGKTAYEVRENICDYNLGWKKNLLDRFGNRWYLAILSPFAISKLPHDGTRWIKKNN